MQTNDPPPKLQPRGQKLPLDVLMRLANFTRAELESAIGRAPAKIKRFINARSSGRV